MKPPQTHLAMPYLLRPLLLTAPALLLPLAATAQVQAQPSLCTKDEVTEWSCTAGRKVYSLCASRDLGPTSGTLQYRAGKKGSKPELAFPDPATHPKGHFVLNIVSRGATLSFSNKGYTYYVYEPLAGQTVIDVSKGDTPIGSITCGNATDTLTLTSTQNRFKTLGVFQ